MPSPYTSTNTPWRVMRGASSVLSAWIRELISGEVISADCSSGTPYFWANSIISGNGSNPRVRMTAGGWKEKSFSRWVRRISGSSSFR